VLISIVVPAFDEEGCPGETLDALDRATAFLRLQTVDNLLPAEIE